MQIWDEINDANKSKRKVATVSKYENKVAKVISGRTKNNDRRDDPEGWRKSLAVGIQKVKISPKEEEEGEEEKLRFPEETDVN